MITKEQFLDRCTKLYPEYDFSNIEWVSYTTPIHVLCNKHGDFEIIPRKLYQQRGKCKLCSLETLSQKNSDNAKERLEKAKQTNLEKYGVENPFQSDEIKQKIKQKIEDMYGNFGTGSVILAKKIADTKEQKYGNSHYTNREKCNKTVYDKYGVSNFGHTPEAEQQKIKTCFQHYGVKHPLQAKEVMDRIKQTNLEKYGVECVFQRKDVVEKSHTEEVKRKRRRTLHQNNTYGKSRSEDRCYNLLYSLFPNAIHHYTSEVYPFECDMYVPELDLYIECNFFWSHGGHFFDSTNQDDLNKVEFWKSKHTKFYDTAVYVWTEADPKKLETAKKNNLNYFVCWTEEEFRAVFNRDFSMHEEIPSNITNVAQVAKLANWTEYFKREIELLKDPEVLGELFINRYKYLGKLPHQLSNLALLNGLSISGKLRKYSTFDNCGMVQFIEKYQPTSIYDPCAGWGERLLTCHQYGIKYFGVDINSKTVEGLNTLIDAYNIDATVLCKDSSQVDSNTYECLFTCPPYWNTEIYTKLGAENLSYEDFLSWWKTVIHKSNCKIVAYQINQKFKKDMNQQLLDLGYSFIEEIVLPQKSSHFTRKDGNRKKEYESIQVFVKK